MAPQTPQRSAAPRGTRSAPRVLLAGAWSRRAALVALAVGLAGSITLAELALAVLAIGLLVDRTRWRRPPLLGPIVAFIAWTAVTALASARPLESLVEARSVLWLATVWVVALALDDATAARRWTGLLFACVAVAAVLAIVQVSVCPPAPPDLPVIGRFLRKCGRARGTFSIYMTLAGVLTLVLVAVLPRLVARRLPLVWAGPGWLAGVAALALTYVRGAWVGFAVGSVAALLATRRRAIVLVALAAVVASALALPGVLSRVRTIGRMADETTRDRLAMLDVGLRMARDHLLTGVGPGQVKHLYPVYAPPTALRRSTSHLHNVPLQILVERGVIGLVLWLAVFVAFFVRAGRVLRALPAGADDDRLLVVGVLAAVAGFLIGGLFEYNFGDTEVLFVACALMALPFVIEREVARRSSASDAGAAAGKGSEGAR